MHSDQSFTGADSNVILVGSKSQFSDCLCRVLLSEIEGSRLMRLPTLAELRTALAAPQLRPELVVVDDSLWETMDKTLLNALRLNCAAIVAVAFRDRARVLQLAERHRLCGAIAFLPMDLNIQSWLSIVRLLLTGYLFVPPDLAKALADIPPADPELRQQAAPEPMPAAFTPRTSAEPGKLTPREAEVLKLMARGLQNKHIAERLELSEHTVKLHVHKVISKLGATNRTGAATHYHQQTVG